MNVRDLQEVSEVREIAVTVRVSFEAYDVDRRAARSAANALLVAAGYRGLALNRLDLRQGMWVSEWRATPRERGAA